MNEREKIIKQLKGLSKRAKKAELDRLAMCIDGLVECADNDSMLLGLGAILTIFPEQAKSISKQAEFEKRWGAKGGNNGESN